MEGLGVFRGMPDVFETVRSTVAAFEPCAAGLVGRYAMNIEFTNRGGCGQRKTATVVDYVRHRLEANSSGGAVESAEENAYSAQYALARLIVLLIDKKVMTLDDIGAVVGAPWDKDDLTVSDAPRDFFGRL